MLDYIKCVTTAIQGGSDSILSRSIFLCNKLVSILSFESLEQFDFKMRVAKKGQALPANVMRPVAEM